MKDGSLTPEEFARYQRQIVLPQIGVAGQEKLAQSRALVVGLGGLGSPAALYLAAAGVGAVGLADFDAVAESNLHRQILHDTRQLRRHKIDSAKERLAALNPQCAITGHRDGIRADNALEIFSQYDVIIDGTDNFPTRYLCNDAAFFAAKPLVHGSVYQFEGQVALFEPAAGGPCCRCLFPQMPAPNTVPTCAEGGVIGALCGVIGSLQAMEAIKRLLSIGDALRGRMLVVDSLAMNFRLLRVKRDPQCPLCGKQPAITGLKAENYAWTCNLPSPSCGENGMSSLSVFSCGGKPSRPVK